jgi:hypothetical protein
MLGGIAGQHLAEKRFGGAKATAAWSPNSHHQRGTPREGSCRHQCSPDLQPRPCLLDRSRPGEGRRSSRCQEMLLPHAGAIREFGHTELPEDQASSIDEKRIAHSGIVAARRASAILAPACLSYLGLLAALFWGEGQFAPLGRKCFACRVTSALSRVALGCPSMLAKIRP